jgi:hypothetical protein
MMTIYDCILLNQRHVGEATVRRQRNLNTLGLFSAGLVFEFREGLRALRDLGIASRLSDNGRERLVRLLQFADLGHEDALRQLRNAAAFHIGEREIALRGIKRLAEEGRELVIASGDGAPRVEGRHDLGIEVILAGINVRPAGVPKNTPHSNQRLSKEELEGAIAEASDGHMAVVEWLDDLFMDLLHQAGANVEPLEPLEGS